MVEFYMVCGRSEEQGGGVSRGGIKLRRRRVTKNRNGPLISVKRTRKFMRLPKERLSNLAAPLET